MKVHQVDVILMDLHMPVLDGVSTTRAIRSLGGALADVKIIMVSADILPEARRLAFDAGVTEFLSKPVQSTKLLKALNRCFEVSLNEFEATRSDANMFDENLESEVFNVRFFYEFRDLMPIELVKKQLKTFFGEDREAVRIISGAIDSEIRKDVSEEAHALKGICQLLGFMAMAQTLAKIEISASDSTLDSLNSLLAQFQDDIDRTRQILISASLLH